jgi:hypothetical protein
MTEFEILAKIIINYYILIVLIINYLFRVISHKDIIIIK